METNQERRNLLCELGLEDSVVFECPDYDSAIIGYDADNYRVIYDFEKMVEHLMKVDNISYEEAVEFIKYNTLRELPYIGSNGPIVLMSIEHYLDYSKEEKNESI
jgi:hypothetical protein